MKSDVVKITDKENDAFQAFLNGRDDESEGLYLSQLQELVDSRSSSLELANAYHNLAQLYYAQRHFEKAEIFYQKAISTHELLNLVDGVSLGICLSQLADIKQQQQYYSEAETLFLKSISLCERDLGGNHSALNSICLEPYARFLNKLGRMTEVNAVNRRINNIKLQTEFLKE